MGMFEFTPMEDGHQNIDVPYFEEARADFAPFYSSFQEGRSVESAEIEMRQEMAKLGGAVSRVVAGKFDTMDPPRYGFQIYYFFRGKEGRLDVACLPFKHSATDRKIKAAQVQALMNVAKWMKTAVTAQVFAPGSNFLVGHLLVDGEHTVNEYIASTGKLPQLTAGKIEVE